MFSPDRFLYRVFDKNRLFDAKAVWYRGYTGDRDVWGSGSVEGSVEARGTLPVPQNITGNRPGLPIIILGKSKIYIFQIFSESKIEKYNQFFHPGVNLLLNFYGCA